MRLAAVLLVSFLIVASSAQVASARGPKSPEETAAYWTKERMQSAIPRDAGRGTPKALAKPGGGGTTSSWTRVAVAPVPYQGLDLNNGKVFFTLGSTNYVCSGTSVPTTTAGTSLVWTAGHCTTDGPNKDATNFTFVPGYYDGIAPKGKWTSGGPDSTDEWRESGNFEYDFGAARVVPAPNSGVPAGVSTLAQIATPRPLHFDYDVTLNSTRFTSYGYPAARPFNGSRMYKCDSPVKYRDRSAMGIGCDMTGGSSGGGWITTVGGVVGVGSVNSYHYQSLKNVMFGPYQGEVAQDLYNEWD